MEAPKCRLCDERHWGLCPATKSVSRPVVDRTPRDGVGLIPSGKPEGLVGPASERDGATANTKPTHKPKFDRNAYQRDLMRKRRAAEKASK